MPYQVTVTEQTLKICHLNQCTRGHVRTWTVAPFQRSRGGRAWFDRHQKCVGKMSLHFQLQLVTGGGF